MRTILLLLFYFLPVTCQNIGQETLVNPAHLQKLYQEMVFDEDSAAFVYIYAEYPEYEPIEATDEGIACIDDVARAAVFYFRYYKITSDKTHLLRGKRLITFIHNLQADNGLYYNFIRADFTINKSRVNSQAKTDWWTWRALWAISEAMDYAKENEPLYFKKLQEIFLKTVNGLSPSGKMSGIISDLAADQASVFLVALVNYYKITYNEFVLDAISQLSANIISKQKGDKDNFPYYAFMSWRNEWHGWGNVQAYALLKAGQILQNANIIKAAENEIIYFYPYIITQNYPKAFRLGENNVDTKFEQFEQIAYAIRPMVWASLELYETTGDKKYAEQAGKLAAWLVGENVTHQPIYNEETGRCYDGINSPTKINLNSGAESTIEALLTIIEVERNPYANDYLKASFQKYVK